MIDIIIPAYNAHKTLKKTLFTVATQDNVKDLKVYIVNDCSKKNYKEEVKMFKNLMFIKEIELPVNSGPGKARQFGLDNTDSEYILFLDADDLLYSNDTCLKLLNAIEGYDMSKGNIEEYKENGEVFVNCFDEYSLHGKLYRRSIIDKYNIQFDPFRSKEANAHEDNSFNNLYELCCEKINIIDDIVYKYVYNEESITKTEVSFAKDMENYVRAMEWLSSEIEKRDIKNKKEIEKKLCYVMTYCFFVYLTDPDKYNFMLTSLSKTKKLYNQYSDDLDYLDKVYIYNLYRYKLIPYITIYQFVDMIKD